MFRVQLQAYARFPSVNTFGPHNTVLERLFGSCCSSGASSTESIFTADLHLAKPLGHNEHHNLKF
jgi:hypothetical protein